MNKLQALQEQLKVAKHQLRLTRPLRGYLGNQYYHWQKVKEKLLTRIDKLKKAK